MSILIACVYMGDLFIYLDASLISFVLSILVTASCLQDLSEIRLRYADGLLRL